MLGGLQNDLLMQRDGLEPKPYSQGIGEKAWWLRQMLELIPPRVWSRESGWTIGELIEAAKRGEWKNVFLDGWSQAARLHSTNGLGTLEQYVTSRMAGGR